MRKITREAINAFMNQEDYKKDNTEVCQSILWTHLYLHGNEIAMFEKDYENEKDIISITTAHWNTNTTLERLRGIPWVNSLRKKQWKLFLNDQEWNGEWIAL